MSAAPAKPTRAPMGRLFWKFFFFFWAAQMVTAIGVGITIWVHRPDHSVIAPAPGQEPPPGEFRPPREFGRPPGGRPPHMHPWRPPLMPIIAGGLVSLIFAALLAWYFARPIRSLRKAFNDLASGNLATRVGDAMGRRRDELTELGGEFDRTAERLQVLIESQQRLLHDVSHELRSPLARLQAAVELMRQQPGRAAEFIDRIERDSGRMDLLVGELLTLARLDAETQNRRQDNREVAGEVVDIADLLAAIAEDAEFEAVGDAGPPCVIQTAFSSPLPVRGERELLHRALENVVRNAVRYTRKAQGDGGEISIAAQVVAAGESGSARQVTIDIADRGPGVPEAELCKIFDPFFRCAGAAAAGYGLGLAISKRVVAAHGGDIAAQNRPQGGLLVRITLPAI